MTVRLLDILTWASSLDVGAVPQLPEWALDLARWLTWCCP